MKGSVTHDTVGALKAERRELAKRLSQIDKAIMAYQGTSYEIPWTTKAIGCLRSFDSFIQTTDILECVLFGNPVLKNKELRRKAMSSLSATLNVLCKDGKLVQFSESGFRGNFYGFPEWVDNEGNPLTKYLKKYYEKYESKIAV